MYDVRLLGLAKHLERQRVGRLEGWRFSYTSNPLIKAGAEDSRVQGFEGAEGRSLANPPIL
jgi:hypothetical protein